MSYYSFLSLSLLYFICLHSLSLISFMFTWHLPFHLYIYLIYLFISYALLSNHSVFIIHHLSIQQQQQQPKQQQQQQQQPKQQQ